DTAVVPPRLTIMPNDHYPAMPQVTAMDDQFGTHTSSGTSQVNDHAGHFRLLIATFRSSTSSVNSSLRGATAGSREALMNPVK
ncbi:MAG: hypothetical protein ACRDSH_01640, partial [Pseudonocardiaceae bacterium]